MSPIPNHIVNTAKFYDFTETRTPSRVCNYCREGAHGKHHYACPVAVDARREERIKNFTRHHEHITFEPEMMQ